MFKFILKINEFNKKQIELKEKEKELIKINKYMRQNPNYKIIYHEKHGLYI